MKRSRGRAFHIERTASAEALSWKGYVGYRKGKKPVWLEQSGSWRVWRGGKGQVIQALQFVFCSHWKVSRAMK